MRVLLDRKSGRFGSHHSIEDGMVSRYRMLRLYCRTAEKSESHAFPR
jgi:hypothetical protein